LIRVYSIYTMCIIQLYRK